MASSMAGSPGHKVDDKHTAIEDKDFFRQWLSGKLKYYNADDEVFLPYIMSILEEAEGSSTQSDDVLESLSDMLEGLGLDEEKTEGNKIVGDPMITQQYIRKSAITTV